MRDATNRSQIVAEQTDAQGIVFIFVLSLRCRAILDRCLCSVNDDEETRKHRSIDRRRARVDSLMIELERPYQ